MNKIIKRALIDSVLTADYIVIISGFIYSLRFIMPKEDSAIIPIAMLLLFVFSAALTAILVFGKPAMIYLNGKKKEAIKLLAYTMAFLFIITILAFILMIILR